MSKTKPQHEPITRGEWDEHFWQHFNALRKQYPTWSLERCRKYAFSATEALHGKRPPSWRWILVKLGWGLVRHGGDMGKNFKKGLTLKKAIKAAALGALVAFLASFDTPVEWTAAGIPEWLAAVAAVAVGAVISGVNNFLKHGVGMNLP